MKRAFTLIEMMIALSICAFVLAALLGMLSGAWMLSKESADELQFAVHLRYLREQLFYHLPNKDYGLTSMTNILFESGEYTATGLGGKVWGAVVPTTDVGKNSKGGYSYSFDVTKRQESEFRNGLPLQYVYLRYTNGKKESDAGYVAYHDRLVVPVFGMHPDGDKDIKECFINEE